MVNEIDNIENWQELGGQLGLSIKDINRISRHKPEEHHQRLVETWFARDPRRSWEKLRKDMKELSSRRGSYDSTSSTSVPSTPSSPTGEYINVLKLIA